MSFKKPIQKTKNFFLKTLQSLKSYLFGGYEKIPRILFLNPLSCSSINNQRSHHLDHMYPHFTNQSTPDHHDQDNADHPMPSNDNLTPKTDANHSHMISCSQQVTVQRKVVGSSSFSSSRNVVSNGTYVLAQKMKQLEMMDLGDVDQSLDVEEALHYYSRLTCPVYVDIVNKFFMDMYADFLLPQPSISISNSSRRLGPLTL